MPCGLFFSKHQNDDAIFKTVWLKCWMVVLGLFLLIFPLYGQQVSDAFGFNTLNLFNLIFIYIVGAHGLNLLTGYTGQISLGHGAFMGVGAYTAGILANLLDLPWVLAIELGPLLLLPLLLPGRVCRRAWRDEPATHGKVLYPS